MKWSRRLFLCLALAALCVLLSASPRAHASNFSLAWQHLGAGGYAEHPIIRNGVVYVPWTDRSVTAIDVVTGSLLHTVAGVNNDTGTAPFIVDNFLYSYSTITATMYAVSLDTFQISRTIPVSNAWYTENVPYDAETGYFFVRQGTDQSKGRVTAFRLSDGMLVWSYPNAFEGGFDNHENILVVGDSVFFQSNNSYWLGESMFYRLDKRTGAVIWAKPLSSIATDDTPRGGYNNPIYDEDHDAIYVSEGWNDKHARVYAFRRSDGGLLWSKDIPGSTIESTMTYYDNILYLPLHVFGGHGSYMAVSATSGETIWHEPGFFNEDGWSATAVDEHYLYRVTHGILNPYLIVQDRLDGSLVWYQAVDSAAVCFNPVASNGIVLLGSQTTVYAIRATQGQAVDSDFHGKNATGYNPGAIQWVLSVKLYLPFIGK